MPYLDLKGSLDPDIGGTYSAQYGQPPAELPLLFGFADLANGSAESGSTRDAAQERGGSDAEEIDRLVVAIVHGSDAGNVNDALQRAGFGFTRISAQGGFLKRGNALFLIGTPSARAAEVFEVIRSSCSQPPAEDGGQSSYGVAFGLKLISFDRV